jgi:branched-chain amino acid transport system ATP-binding protein
MSIRAHQPLLQLVGLTRRFGGVVAVDNVSLTIGEGEIVGLIGPNGAGKTTLVNLVTGLIGKTAGRVLFAGREIGRLPPQLIARGGVARTFQIVQPFPEMTVLENVMAGALFAGGSADMRAAAARAQEKLEFVGLAPFARAPAAELSLANRKRLELAKSLAMRPRLLFLDEVNAGLSSTELDRALELIRAIAATGVTIVIIEHLLRVVVSLVGRIVVLHHGALLSEGPPHEVLNDPAVIKAYLGNKFAQRHQAELEEQRLRHRSKIGRGVPETGG